MRGRLAVLSRPLSGIAHTRAYEQLLNTVALLSTMSWVPFDLACEAILQQLIAMRLRVGTRDLKIAAVALANNLVVLTRNKRDFGRVPGLAIDAWSI